jgi:hypothetical protein
MIEPQVLTPLTEEQRLALIDCFKNNTMLQEYPGRAFALDLGPALEIVKPIIDGVLGIDAWEVAGGNFFETSTGYRVHADTGKEGPGKVWQTFVFPLSMELDPTKEFQPEKNRLVILNQTWTGDAAFFLRGSPDEPNEYNIVVKDYADVIGLVPGAKDPILYDLCPHLNSENFLGLTVDKTFQWTPGIPMTFPRNRLHSSTAFPRRGIKKKLGLSIFTSKKQ